MSDQALLPFYAERAAHLASLATPQGEALIPLDPAEFDRRFGHLPSYTEKSLLAYGDQLIEKGMGPHSTVAHLDAHRAGMERVLVGSDARGIEARYVDHRTDAQRAQVAAAAPDPYVEKSLHDLNAFTTEAELLAQLGAGNVYSDESFVALRHHVLEKGMRTGEADEYVEKSRQDLVELKVADRRGHVVTRYVPKELGLPETAAAEATE